MRFIADVEHTWIGIAAVVAAIGSATAAIIGAINGQAVKRTEGKIDQLNGKQ